MLHAVRCKLWIEKPVAGVAGPVIDRSNFEKKNLIRFDFLLDFRLDSIHRGHRSMAFSFELTDNRAVSSEQ